MYKVAKDLFVLEYNITEFQYKACDHFNGKTFVYYISDMSHKSPRYQKHHFGQLINW